MAMYLQRAGLFPRGLHLHEEDPAAGKQDQAVRQLSPLSRVFAQPVFLASDVFLPKKWIRVQVSMVVS